MNRKVLSNWIAVVVVIVAGGVGVGISLTELLRQPVLSNQILFLFLSGVALYAVSLPLRSPGKFGLEEVHAHQQTENVGEEGNKP